MMMMRCDTVVAFCHSKIPVMARFLFRAQDQNMTNGDFVFFTWWPVRSLSKVTTYQPWTMFVDDAADIPRRRRAFQAVKQVRPSLFPTIVITYHRKVTGSNA